MKEIDVLSGVSGVGKDFILNKLEQYDDLPFERVNLGRLISEEFDKNPERGREENIDQAFNVAGRIAVRNLGRTILNLYNTYGENPEVQHSNQIRIQNLPLDKSLVVESDPDIIMARRGNDAQFRNRAQNSQQEIAKIQQLSTDIARTVAKQKGVPFKVFRNDGDLNIENVRDFLEDQNKKFY